MRNLFAFLLLTFICLHSKSQTSQINIRYEKPINGYEVSVVWVPAGFSESSHQYLCGPAILIFNDLKTGQKYYVQNKYFSDHIGQLNVNKVVNSKGDINKFQSFSITVKNSGKNYTIIKDTVEGNLYQYYEHDVPFFFDDLDFDDRKELILTQPGRGIKFTNANVIYRFDETDASAYELNGAPFSEFNDYGEPEWNNVSLDRTNKELTIENSSGCCHYIRKYYKWIEEVDFQRGYYKLMKTVEDEPMLDNDGNGTDSRKITTTVPKKISTTKIIKE